MDNVRQPQEILKEKLDNFQTNCRDLEENFEHCSVDDGSLILRMGELLDSFDDIIETNRTADENCIAVLHFTLECISRGELEKEDEICREVKKNTDIQMQTGELLINIHKGIVQVRQMTDFVTWNLILTALRGLIQ